jgi:hypothetical protein
MLHVDEAWRDSRQTRRLSVLIALTVALAVSFWMAAPRDAHADPVAQPFCAGAWLTPQGQGGDKCFSSGQWLTGVWGRAYNASVCVNGWINGGPASNWACQVTGVYAQIGFNGSRFMNGVIANNNPNSWNQVADGWYWHNG